MKNVNPMSGSCGFSEIVFNKIVEKCGYPKSVIELGCGNGGNLSKFEKSMFVRGIDPYEANTKSAIKNYEIKNNRLFILGDHTSLKRFKNNRFDVGFTVSVLNHIENTSIAIKEMLRVSKKVVFIEPYIEGVKRQAFKSEVSNWANTWFHDYLEIIKSTGYKYQEISSEPLPLYKTNCGPYYHLFFVR